MTAAHRRGARFESRTAKTLGGKRVRWRPRGVSAPDIVPITAPDATVYVLECKVRCIPKWVRAGLAQARRYAPSPTAVPLLVVNDGGEALVVVPLDAFARVAGLQSRLGEQLTLVAVQAEVAT